MEYDDLKHVLKKLDTESESGWRDLPENILVRIFKFLAIKDILNSAATCLRWNFISQDEVLWKYKFQTDYKVTKNIARKPGKGTVISLKISNYIIRLRDTRFFIA